MFLLLLNKTLPALFYGILNILGSVLYAYFPNYRSKNNCIFVLWESKSNTFCQALTRTGFRFKKTKNKRSSITKGIEDQKSQSVRINEGRIKETRVYKEVLLRA
jgi:hypothetical protein